STSTIESFRRVVLSRRAAYRFGSENVADEVMKDIMDLTQRAPSSFNAQPWSVVLVREQAQRERLAEAMMGGNGAKVKGAPVVAVFCAD
ncbi:unnamed protein product, partial [Discosporangium mesarthrocarpum]